MTRGKHVHVFALGAGARTAGNANCPAHPQQAKESPRVARSAEQHSGELGSAAALPGSPAPGPTALPSSVRPLEILSRLPHGRLLRGLHGLLHVDDELRGLPALRVDGHRLDALHVVG